MRQQISPGNTQKGDQVALEQSPMQVLSEGHGHSSQWHHVFQTESAI